MMALAGSTVLVGLAWFAGVMAATSGLLWPGVAVLRRHPVRLGADALFTLRLLPVLTATLVTLLLIVPAHWRFEPEGLDEAFGVAVWLLAAAGASLFAESGIRAARVARTCRTARARWTAAGTARAGVVEIDDVPNIALAGILRTTIWVGTPVRRALTDAELEVAVAHEVAHRRERDNLKRFLLAVAPDVLRGTAAARWLEHEWAAAAECQADARAVAGDDRRALHLASALLKVARLSESAGRVGPLPAWSTFYDRPLIDLRVRRLVGGRAPLPVHSRTPPSLVAAVTVAVAGVIWVTGGLFPVHLLTERLVRYLS